MSEISKEAKEKAKEKGKEILESVNKKGAQDFSALVAERLPELSKLADVHDFTIFCPPTLVLPHHYQAIVFVSLRLPVTVSPFVFLGIYRINVPLYT